MGSDLFEILAYDGWPTKEGWQKWEAWWEAEVQNQNQAMTRKGEKGLSDGWHFKVTRLSALVHSAVNEFVLVALENHTQWSTEKWMWRFTLIKNALTELKILPWPLPKADSWFNRIDQAGTCFFC